MYGGGAESDGVGFNEILTEFLQEETYLSSV